jgi:AraC-like DNA-binding protein
VVVIACIVAPWHDGGVRLSPAILRRLIRAQELARDAFDEPLSIDDLAGAAGLSRFHFVRSFRAAFGLTPHAYLTRVRLDQARRRLARGASVTEACLATGFVSVGSFSTLFKREVGDSPRAWQRRARATIPVPALWPAVFIPSCYVLAYAPSNFREARGPHR